MFDDRSENDPYTIDGDYNPSAACNCPKGYTASTTSSSCICVDDQYLGPPLSVCPPGMTFLGTDEFGEPVCGVQTPDYNPNGTPPPLACEPGYHSIFLADGSQACVPDGGVTTTVDPPTPVVQNPFGTPTTPTPTTGGGILDLLPDGIVDDNGLIFGFSPLVVLGAVAVGGYLLMNGSKGK